MKKSKSKGKKMKKNISSFVMLLAALILFVFTGCDNNPAASTGTGGDSVDPTIPAEFSEMESITFSGTAPTTIDEVVNSMIYAQMNIMEPVYEVYANSDDSDFSDIESFIDSIMYGTEPAAAITAISVNDAFTSGSVDIALDETFQNASFKGALVASVSQSNLIEMVNEALVLPPDNLPITDGSFSITFDLSGLDLKVTDAAGEEYAGTDPETDEDIYEPSGIDTEYLRFLADISLTISGTGLGMSAPTDTGEDDYDGNAIMAMTLSGTLDFDIDIDIKAGYVLSSSDPAVNGCKVVITEKLTDALTGFNLDGINVMDYESLMTAILDFVNQISMPEVTFDVFDSDNTFLFSETMSVSDELDDLLAY
ncbi:MAG: hypothetical protein JXR86_12535 [Spirochaetales bacterium]|nr:hypothetical protein [Spirochaetales bacterium]